MPTTHWTAGPDPHPDTPVHIVATEFHLPRMADTFAFLRATREITSSLRDADGLVGYALQARILSRTYRTVSAWRSPAHATAFARAGAHGRVAAAARGGTAPKSLTTWSAPAGDPPPSWDEVERRLREASAGEPARAAA